MLTPRQAFKVAFLSQCAADGLSVDETVARIDVLEKAAGVEWDFIKSIPGGVGSILSLGTGALTQGTDLLARGAGIGLLGAAGIGGLGGFTAAKLNEGSLDPEEIRRQEMIATLNTFADRVEETDKERKRRQTGPARVSVRLH